MNKTPSPSFLACFARAFGGALLLVSLATASILVPGFLSESPTMQPYTPGTSQVVGAEDDKTPLGLVEKHDCWTGEAPADMVDVVPGHVVTQNGYEGSEVVGQALEQMFEGASHNLTVYGFCR